ncbi:MAG: hypothetical protein ACT4QG_01315 [Sporichthyaceae bacterium]
MTMSSSCRQAHATHPVSWRRGALLAATAGSLVLGGLLVPQHVAQATVAADCNEPPPPPAPVEPPKEKKNNDPPEDEGEGGEGEEGDVAVPVALGQPAAPVDDCSNAGSSNDPNPNTNPQRQRQLREPLPGMDPSTATAVCRPGESCSVTPPPGPDSGFQIDSSGGTDQAVLFATTNGTFRPASVEREAPKGRPDCPDYTEQNIDWVQFGFLDAKSGSTWNKTAAMTQRKKTKKAAAFATAQRLQICFAAPYAFPTREGYRLGKADGERVGVLPECTARTSKKSPCVVKREIVQVKGGWVARLTFRVPANAKDPKALG